jgi:hypothetical protein
MDTQTPDLLTGPRVPVAFAGRTSTLTMQDPVASMRRQVRSSQEKLPPGWFFAAWYWDIESGGLDLEARGHGSLHELVPEIGIPRDGGLADLLAEAHAPQPRFAAVICEDIERSGRDTFNALKLEKELSACGVPLFATDEPINLEGVNATTVLVRRVKQGVAEWFRLQIKEKAWKGLREHCLDGWNIGPPPYGYTGQRVPHPVAVKAAQGRTKTRLILDPATAPAVAQIFTWRATRRLGITTITQRLAADPGKYPPPPGGQWSEIFVYQILANPKYTGHMVFGRTTKKGGRRRPVPPEQWIWSPEPTHPPIITRKLYNAAQKVTARRDSISADPGTAAHPLARRSYEFRSLIRHRACKRRMNGITRPAGVYYLCPHDTANPRHLAACPDHPTTVTIREDHLRTVVCQFVDERLSGPDRAALLAEQLPANDAEQAARTTKQAARLDKKLSRLQASQDALIKELETIRPSAPAADAMRDRIYARFTELETDRTHTRTELATLTTHQAPTVDPGLLDALPQLPARFADLPVSTRHKLYQAFGIEILFNHGKHQITCRATITTSTPSTVAAIINDTQPPTPTSSDFLSTPIGDRIRTDHEIRSRGVWAGKLTVWASRLPSRLTCRLPPSSRCARTLPDWSSLPPGTASQTWPSPRQADFAATLPTAEICSTCSSSSVQRPMCSAPRSPFTPMGRCTTSMSAPTSPLPLPYEARRA